MIKLNAALIIALTPATPSFAQSPINGMVEECLAHLSAVSMDVPGDWELSEPIKTSDSLGWDTVLGIWNVSRHNIRFTLRFDTAQDTGNRQLMCIIGPDEGDRSEGVLSAFNAWEQGIGLNPAFSLNATEEKIYVQRWTYVDCISSDAPRQIGASWPLNEEKPLWQVSVLAYPDNKELCDGVGS